MVREEIISETLVRHYSDSGLMLKQVETGFVYGEAIDVIPCRYTYEEVYNPDDDDDVTDEELRASLEAIL